LIPVIVESVRKSLKEKTRVIILKELEGERQLPIWMGQPEADAIQMQLKEVKTKRPLTYDLFQSIFNQSGLTLEKAIIYKVEADTYFTQLQFTGSQHADFIEDSRPSDAINLALRAGAPILVAEAVMAQMGIQTTPPKVQEEADNISILRRRGEKIMASTIPEKIPPDVQKRHLLRQKLGASFNLEELKHLSFDLNIDYENLPFTTKDLFIRELLLYCERAGRLPILMALVRQERPHISWD
jgi:bifunctional DNase/RNase